ncbi:hypothetical protein Tco_0777899 [Tanacetum coccineum]
MFMLGPKPMSFYDSKVKHGLGYTNPYTLRKAISQNPKLYDASCLDDSKIHVNVRDTEDILDDATKSQIKMKKKSQDPIAIEKKQNVWTSDYKKLNDLYEDFVPQKEFSAEQKYFSSSFISFKNSSNASSPSSSSETKPTVAPMPTANPMKLIQRDERMFLNHRNMILMKHETNDLIEAQLLKIKLSMKTMLCVVDHECLGHNLFSVGQFYDGDLEVAFCSNTCYVRNLEGDDLLTGARESNLYTISILDMVASSLVLFHYEFIATLIQYSDTEKLQELTVNDPPPSSSTPSSSSSKLSATQRLLSLPSAVRPRDQDDPYDDAHPEGENSAKSVTRTYVRNVNKLLMKQIMQSVVNEVLDNDALQELRINLLYLKKGNSGPEKIVMSLHKFPAVIFPDDDIEERASRCMRDLGDGYLRKDKNRSQNDKTEHENGKSVKRSQNQSQAKKSKSTKSSQSQPWDEALE